MYKSVCYTSLLFFSQIQNCHWRWCPCALLCVLSCVYFPMQDIVGLSNWGNWPQSVPFQPIVLSKDIVLPKQSDLLPIKLISKPQPRLFVLLFVWNWGQYGFTNWSCKTDLIELYGHLQKYFSRWNYSQRCSLWIGIDWSWNPPWRDKITSIRDATIPQLGDSPVLSVKNYPSPHLYFSLNLTLHSKLLYPALYTTFNWTLPSGLS